MHPNRSAKDTAYKSVLGALLSPFVLVNPTISDVGAQSSFLCHGKPLVLEGKDDLATEAIAQVIKDLGNRSPVYSSFPNVRDFILQLEILAGKVPNTLYYFSLYLRYPHDLPGQLHFFFNLTNNQQP